MVNPSERDPLRHTRKMKTRLQETINHLREDIEKVDEPQLKAMFETSAEVLGGLTKAFSDYEPEERKSLAKIAVAVRAGVVRSRC